ncbi:EscE/YscE/SsaE family type III secretion system needle protein co-chaperone [Methylobacterium hispanicum]|uniref:EscE/YscE/SsaE family type III secretion system needle protein co-chaperone n=1 Tax=Methylobacterium hispanicum TaxID=270350 RepID=UPI002F318065
MDADRPEPSFGMTDFEEALRGPSGGEVRRASLARLDAALDRVEVQLRAGLDPRHRAPTQSLRAALVTARDLLAAAPTD